MFTKKEKSNDFTSGNIRYMAAWIPLSMFIIRFIFVPCFNAFIEYFVPLFIVFFIIDVIVLFVLLNLSQSKVCHIIFSVIWFAYIIWTIYLSIKNLRDAEAFIVIGVVGICCLISLLGDLRRKEV